MRASSKSGSRRWRGLLVAAAALSTLSFAPSGAPAPAATAVRAAVDRHLARNGGAVVRELASLLALPNLAFDESGIRKNAEHIASLLRARGLGVRLLDGAGGPPVVLGELRTKGARRTLVIYAHYDGQPVDPAQWQGAPWTPVLRDGPLPAGGEQPLLGLTGPLPSEWRLFGRSASDDKAPIVGVLAALDALKAAGIAPTVNLLLFFEGEEEAGSPHLREVLTRNREALAADAWLFCDGPVHQSRQMQLFFGARGVTTVELTVYGPVRALHSGHYGNWVPNPAMTLAHLVGSLRDPQGRILIKDFAQDVRAPTPAELQAAAAAPPVEGALQDEFALGSVPDPGTPLAVGVLQPALNVRGIRSGAVGETAANAVPTEATASLDFRLVPNQTPATVRARLETHLREEGWTIVHDAPSPAFRRAHARVIRLDWGSGYPASRTPLDLPASRAVAKVMAQAIGAPPVLMPTLGGSLPMHVFQEVLGRPVIGLPIANHDNNQHAANENLRLQNLTDGIQVYAALLARLGPAWEAEEERR